MSVVCRLYHTSSAVLIAKALCLRRAHKYSNGPRKVDVKTVCGFRGPDVRDVHLTLYFGINLLGLVRSIAENKSPRAGFTAYTAGAFLARCAVQLYSDFPPPGTLSFAGYIHTCWTRGRRLKILEKDTQLPHSRHDGAADRISIHCWVGSSCALLAHARVCWLSG